MIDRNHPAVDAGAEGMEYPHTPTAHDAIVAALPHLESATEENIARLRDTPAGRALMREAAVNARSPHPHWISTPDGTLYDAHLPGDEVRARNLDARRRETMLNMRESDEGRALMAEAWDAAWKRAWGPAACELTPNPYRTETPSDAPEG